MGLYGLENVWGCICSVHSMAIASAKWSCIMLLYFQRQHLQTMQIQLFFWNEVNILIVRPLAI